MTVPKSDILQGTLDLMVLTTLEAMGPLHGYGLARRIEQLSDRSLLVNDGTIYTSLVRLQQRGWIAGEWGASDNNRRAKFYHLTRAGRTQLKTEAASWRQVSTVMGRFLRLASRGQS